MRTTRRAAWWSPLLVSSTLALVIPGASLVDLSPARADIRRLAVVDMDDTLEQAVETALEPWSVAVIPLDAPAPGATMPGSARRAREIAHDNTAGAVTWIAGDGRDSALWLYDLDSDRVVASRLSVPPPYDEPTAAGVALTVKTLLRHSTVAPESERLALPPTPRPDVTLAFELNSGVRMREADALTVEQRTGVAMMWFPARMHGVLALGARLDAGPGLTVDVPSFAGHYTDTAFGLLSRGRLGLGSRVTATGSVGTTVHLTVLDGIPLAGDAAIRQRRVNPSLDAGLGVHVRLIADMMLGITAQGSYMVRRQRYLAGQEVVLELPSVELQFGLALTLASRQPRDWGAR